jgi:RES domain-containing protein
MHVYRITLEKYSGALVASGNPARWNSKDIKMIYTASSRALACLENVVHRNALGLQSGFRTMVIQIPQALYITIIEKESLLQDWHLFENYPLTQAMGDAWIKKGETAVLRIPSAIIAEECNYLLNPGHKDFEQIKVIRTEPFSFDQRIKS